MTKIIIMNEKNERLLSSFDFFLLLPILCHCCYQMTVSQAQRLNPKDLGEQICLSQAPF